MVRSYAFVLALSVGILMILLTPNISNRSPIVGALTQNPASTAPINSVTSGNIVKVKVGGGDSNMSTTQYFPQIVEIKAGSSVTWYNPTQVPEAHTVTFQMGSLFPTQQFLPVGVSKSAQLTSLPSDSSNGEPIIIPGQNQTNFLIVANARAYNPVVIGSNGNVTFLNWDTRYIMHGNEKYINSGWLFPTGEIPPGIQAGRTFTITFEKAGLYQYSCIFHPWMTGKVIVK